MSVPVGKRGENTLEVWQEAVKLCKYTMELIYADSIVQTHLRYARKECTDRATPLLFERRWKELKDELQAS